MKKKSQAARKSISTTAGVAGILGSFLIIGAVLLSTNHFLAFFSLEGLMIVVGGVLAVAFMSYQSSDVRLALQSIRQMFGEHRAVHDHLYKDMINVLIWAQIVKEKGLRGLEENIDKAAFNDPFVKYGLNMVVSNYSPEEVRTMMETAAEAYYERDIVPAQVLQSMASHAPAFGMVGTLIGMVTMLCNLNGGDVSHIGSSLAVSFLATLYGVISARMVYMPAAARYTQRVDNLRFRNHLITEGMVMLVADKSPSYIQDHLNSFMRPEIQEGLNMSIQNHKTMLLRASAA